MPFSRFRSVRSRLAAIALAAAVPMTAIIGVNALLTSRTVRDALEAVPEATATALRQSLQSSFVGAARVGLTATEAVADRDVKTCEAFLGKLLALNSGYMAVRVDRREGSCLAVRPQDRPRAASIASAFDRHASGVASEPLATFAGEVAVASALADGLRTTFVRARRGSGDQRVTAWVMLGPDLLKLAIAGVNDRAPGHVALVDSASRPIILSDETDETWLPSGSLAGLKSASTYALATRDGGDRRYAVYPLAAENIYVVAAMDAEAARGLNWQLAVALLAPLGALLLIAIAYSRTMTTSFTNWIEQLGDAARRSGTDPGARAPVSAAMPEELASVATSMNEMLTLRQARESALSAAVAHNQYLARELHHRVKNSLQMVQSYLSLGARGASAEATPLLLGAQARTYVLAAAYRRALDQNEFVAFELDPYLAEVADFAAGLLKRGDQGVERTMATQSQVGIDEAIPLGMIIAELIEAGLREPGNRALRLSFTTQGDTTMIEATAPGGRLEVRSRLFKGLLAQIGAAQQASGPDTFRAAFSPLSVSASTLLRKA